MAGEKVLVCGAEVAGSILLSWLAKYGYRMVIIERSKAHEKAGQGVDIEQPALQVVEATGILDELKAVRTGEGVFELFNQQEQIWATFSLVSLGPTGALELTVMRGDFTEVLYKAADKSDSLTFHFQTTIKDAETDTRQGHC